MSRIEIKFIPETEKQIRIREVKYRKKRRKLQIGIIVGLSLTTLIIAMLIWL